MATQAKILADSVSPAGVRLTTFEVTFPRIILAEFNTHRMFSRNSASSRAIPVEKMIRAVQEDPYVPSIWGANQKGMQAGVPVDDKTAEAARMTWLHARDQAVEKAEILLKHGIHKQLTNRLLEPFLWHTVIVTATEWSNFFHLRDNPQAHPGIQILARMIRTAYGAGDPEPIGYDEWHLPLIGPEDCDLAFEHGLAQRAGDSTALAYFMRKVSVARCARVSYLTHDGKRDLLEDLGLYERLLSSGHLSPFEHVARPMLLLEQSSAEPCDNALVSYRGACLPWPYEAEAFCGNFRGWIQERKLIPNEHNILGATQ